MVLANWTIKFWNIWRTIHVFTIQTREMVMMHPGLLFPNKSTQNGLRTLKIGTVSFLLILSCDISLVCIIICDVFFFRSMHIDPKLRDLNCISPFHFIWARLILLSSISIGFRLITFHFISFVRMKYLEYISMKWSKNERTGHVNQMIRENRNIQISKKYWYRMILNRKGENYVNFFIVLMVMYVSLSVCL